MNRRNNILTYTVAIFSIIISFVLVVLSKGLENVSIDGVFDLQKIFAESLTSITFWILNASISIATAMIFYWAFTLRKTKLLSSEEWENKVTDYNNHVKFKRKDFVDFVKEENNRRRIASYLNHMENKIMKKEKRLARVTGLGLLLKVDQRINNKIKRIQEKTTKEYLAEHKVWWWFNVVSPSEFRYGNFYVDDIQDRTSSREHIKVTTKMAKKVIISLAVSTVTLSFLISLLVQFQLSVGFWIVILTVTMTLLMNLYLGMQFGERIYRTEYVLVTENKIAVLKDYITWSKEQNNQEQTYADKVLAAYENNIKLKEELDAAVKKAESIQIK